MRLPITIVTSFNSRIFHWCERSHHPFLQKQTDILKEFPCVMMYHENSIEDSWPIDTRKLLGPIDLHQAVPTFLPFVEQTKWFHEPLADGYWNSNAKHWLRKVAALRHAVSQCDTEFMMWLDADVSICDLPNTTFLRHCEQASIAVWERSERRAIHSCVVVFNLHHLGKQYVEAWWNAYESGRAFTHDRYDDGAILTYISREDSWDRTYLTRKYNAPFDVWQFFKHATNGTPRGLRSMPIK